MANSIETGASTLPTTKIAAAKSNDQPSWAEAATVADHGAAIGPTDSSKDANASHLSKNQQKKLKRKLEWEEGRDGRKAKRREKAKERKEKKREARDDFTLSGIEPTDLATRPKVQQKKVPLTIVMDCDFEELMNEGELISLASQLTRSYSDTRKAAFRPHLTISSFKGRLRDRFETALTRNHENWKGVSFCHGDFIQAAEDARNRMLSEKSLQVVGALSKGKSLLDHEDMQSGVTTEGQDTDSQSLISEGEVVYLSSDAAETLHDLKPYSTYIIGGLVDKNRHKGVCHRRAMERNIKTAKLPIGEYLNMQSRKVLTTNQVNEIIVKWLELGEWGPAFLQVIPQRKGGLLAEGHKTDVIACGGPSRKDI